MNRGKPGILLYLWVLGSWVVFAAWLLWGSATGLPQPWFGVAAIVLGLIALWAGVALGVRLFASRPRSAGAAFTSGASSSGELLGMTRGAVARYLKSLDRKNVLRSWALYERPWILVFGDTGCGCSSLLDKCGVDYVHRYPSEQDGLRAHDRRVPRFLFGNEAVFVDTPGAFADPSGNSDWVGLAKALKAERPLCPADAAVVVVALRDIVDGTPETIKTLGERLRARIDALIGLWGVEIPVYLVFSGTDSMVGFADCFAPGGPDLSQEVLGASVGSEQTASLPRHIFGEEFALVCRSLSQFRIGRLVRESGETTKRDICRFVIQFEALQEKISALVSEVFKPSGYVGKPVFKGFYFTGATSSSGNESPLAPFAAQDGNTIAAHPLNPHRERSRPAALSMADGAVKAENALFASALFGRVIPHGVGHARATGQSVRSNTIRLALSVAATVLAAGIASTWIVSSFGKSQAVCRAVQSDLQQASRAPSTVAGRWAALELVGRNAGTGSNRPGAGFDPSPRLKTAVIGRYGAALESTIGRPVAMQLERTIADRSAHYRQENARDYQDLYRILKVYLSMTEQVSSHRNDIDTVLLKSVLAEVLTESMVGAGGARRLPARMEELIERHSGWYARLLRAGRVRPLQENQTLVRGARACLGRIPGAASLYKTVMERLRGREPSLTLETLLDGQRAAYLVSTYSVNALYTQDGWDRVVREALVQASQNPFATDWVCGAVNSPVIVPKGDKLNDELIQSYRADFEQQWLRVLGGLTVVTASDPDRCREMLVHLSADNSELVTVLEGVCERSRLTTGSNAERAVEGLGSAIQERTANTAAGKLTGAMARGSEDRLFERLRMFVRSQESGQGGLRRYRELAGLVAGAVERSRDPAKALTVCNGGPDDPLLSAWNETRVSLEHLGPQLNPALHNLFLAPLEQAGIAITASVDTAINDLWKAEIAEPFARRFNGRYPFVSRADAADFDDVMSFFRPSTGTWWGLHERALNAYVVNVGGRWQGAANALIRPAWNPALFAAYAAADRIGSSLFGRNGELRPLSIRVELSGTGAVQAVLTVDGQEIVVKAGSVPAAFSWPAQSHAAGAVLAVTVNGGYTRELRYDGKWGFMQLIDKATVRSQSPSVFVAHWRVNVQNMYEVPVALKFTVSRPNHPFVEPLFEAFVCPETAVK